MNEQMNKPVPNSSPTPQPARETQSQPAKKAWSQPIMTLLEISATASNAGNGGDGSELGSNAS